MLKGRGGGGLGTGSEKTNHRGGRKNGVSAPLNIPGHHGTGEKKGGVNKKGLGKRGSGLYNPEEEKNDHK